LRRDPQFATDTVRIGLFVHSTAESTNDFTVAGVTDTNFVGTLSYDNDGDFTRVLQPCQILDRAWSDHETGQVVEPDAGPVTVFDITPASPTGSAILFPVDVGL
jgi:hypothetical protein